MKLKNFTALLAIAASFLCCERDEGFSSKPYQDSYPINISGQISQQYITRVDDGGFCDGDQVGLYGVNYLNNNTTPGTLNNEGNQVDNARYTYDEANNTWKATGNVYYKDANTNIDLYAYYPYDTPTSVSGYEFEVHQNQAGTGTVDGYALSDFLWAKAENVAPSENKVKLKFSHRLACANVVLVKGTGFEEGEFEAMEKSVLVMNTSRTASINLQTGEATVTGTPASEGIVMMNSADGFRAIVIPQTVGANTALFSITLDGITYRFKKDKAFTYEAGKQALFTIELNKKSPSGEVELNLINTEIKEWVADSESHNGQLRQYYVVNLEQPGTLGRLLKAAKKNPDKIKNLKISGKINAGDFYFMRDSMELLQAINLKEAEIRNSIPVHYTMLDGSSVKIYESVEKKERYSEDLTSHEEYLKLFEERHKEFENLSYAHYTDIDWAYDNEIPREAFCDKKSITNFSFPEKVTGINQSAFEQTLLSGALIIPDDVIYIGSNSFAYTLITSLELPHKIKEIGGYAFESCKYLSGNIVFPESLEELGERAFYSCSMLSGHLSIPSKITIIPDNCFTECKFTSISIPSGVTTIGSRAFWKNPLKNLTLPENLTEIGSAAFWKCI